MLATAVFPKLSATTSHLYKNQRGGLRRGPRDPSGVSLLISPASGRSGRVRKISASGASRTAGSYKSQRVGPRPSGREAANRAKSRHE